MQFLASEQFEGNNASHANEDWENTRANSANFATTKITTPTPNAVVDIYIEGGNRCALNMDNKKISVSPLFQAIHKLQMIFPPYDTVIERIFSDKLRISPSQDQISIAMTETFKPQPKIFGLFNIGQAVLPASTVRVVPLIMSPPSPSKNETEAATDATEASLPDGLLRLIDNNLSGAMPLVMSVSM